MAEEAKKNPLIEGKPEEQYALEIEEAGAGVERFYFWILNFIQSTPPSGLNYKRVEKIRDIFSASESSSYFGNIEQRKGLQQDKVSQFLATVGKMLKDTFQIIRELRIIEERLDYYKKSEAGDESSEIALKSIWIDLVEGGAKNPTSVLGLATQVGFTILPDLFFHIHPKNSKDVEGKVSSLSKEGINKKVQEVLSRKLTQYITWKETTRKEINQRWTFILKYLRQHYETIRLYMTWVRPYLKNIKKLQMQETDKPEMISAFETSLIEIEILAIAKEKGKSTYNPCIHVKFEYVAIPQMAYQQELQRGAIHTGRTNITMSAYSLTEEQIEDYKKKKEEEDMELLSSLNSAMDALKDDLKKYLEKADGEFKEKKEEKKKEISAVQKLIKGLTDPIKDVKEGFTELFKLQKSEDKNVSSWKAQQEKKKGETDSVKQMFILYDVFKKAHGMVTW